jgi:plasmid stabilization system protein ParE
VRHAVEVAPSAAREAAEAHAYIAADSPAAADLWLEGLEGAIDSLELFPRRCAPAPEADVFREEIRQLLYGSYRIIFAVSPGLVRILHIRHAARQSLGE